MNTSNPTNRQQADQSPELKAKLAKRKRRLYQRAYRKNLSAHGGGTVTINLDGEAMAALSALRTASCATIADLVKLGLLLLADRKLR